MLGVGSIGNRKVGGVWRLLSRSPPRGDRRVIVVASLGDDRERFAARSTTPLPTGQVPRLVAAVALRLDDLHVTIIVIDDRIPPEHQLPYQTRLEKLVVSESAKWQLIGPYPQTKEGIVFPNSLHVYARRPLASLAMAAPTIRPPRRGGSRLSGPIGGYPSR
jgi:hypothetical protein